MAPYINTKQFVRGYYVRPTTFYPLYSGVHDQVNRVLKVQPVWFQRVFPRYRLSTSVTRDTGLGPPVERLPVLIHLYKKANTQPWIIKACDKYHVDVIV